MANISYLQGGVNRRDVETRLGELRSMLGIIAQQETEQKDGLAASRRTRTMIEGGIVEVQAMLARIDASEKRSEGESDGES
jgi:hypothetical protein